MKNSLSILTNVFSGPRDEVEELLVQRQTGACPAPTDTVHGDQDGVARELFERINDYDRVRVKFESEKPNNFRFIDEISIGGSITKLMYKLLAA